MADINDCLNGATHGPVHILIGGAWGEGTLFDDPDIEFVQMPDKLLFFKVVLCPDPRLAVLFILHSVAFSLIYLLFLHFFGLKHCPVC
jgi:hypothetical protein